MRRSRVAGGLLGKTMIAAINEAGSVMGSLLAGGCHQPHHLAVRDWLRPIQDADALVARTG